SSRGAARARRGGRRSRVRALRSSRRLPCLEFHRVARRRGRTAHDRLFRPRLEPVTDSGAGTTSVEAGGGDARRRPLDRVPQFFGAGGVGARFQLFFGRFEVGLSARAVDVGGRSECVDQQRDLRGARLGEAGAYGRDEVLAVTAILEQPRAERGEQRKVTREDAELAVDARRLDRVDLGRKGEPLRRRHLEGERLGDGHRSGFLRARGVSRLHVVEVALEVEVLLGDVVALAGEDLLEGRDALRERDVLALEARELLGDEEGLAEEALDLAGAVDRLAVVLGKLVHTENGNDVLQILVLLQGLLDAAGDLVVAVAEDRRVEHRGGRVERVDGRVDAELRDGTRQNGRRVQVGEGRRGRRVREVVGGHVDGLDGGDGALRRRGDALLELAHLRREGRLVTDGARRTAEESGDLGARLREAEDVVDEQK